MSQAENYDYCIGSGRSLLERGWSFPVKEVETSRLDELLNDGLDIFWPLRCRDDKYLYILWDIEYFNKENPSYLFDRENQRQIFEWMAPALNIIEEILSFFGIKYLTDITMSGVHIWSKIETASPAFGQLAEEGAVLPSLSEKYSQVIKSDRKRINPPPPALGRAYNTAGKILEYITHILIRKNKELNPFKIPVTISDSPQYDKTFTFSGISSDLTQYAHPIYMRCIRAFCSLHQKSLLHGYEDLGPAIDIVKFGGMTYQDALTIMWDADAAISFYEKNFAGGKINIPESSAGWSNALKSYKKSELRTYHKKWENCPATSDLTEFILPAHPRISKIFDNVSANPMLLVPDNLQFLAEYSGADIASAKKIFSVIADKYYMNKSLGWYDTARFTGIDWNKYDAWTASDFWGRVYWSLNAAGLGRGIEYAD